MLHINPYLYKEGIERIERLPSLIGNTTHNQKLKYLHKGPPQEINRPIGCTLLVFNHQIKPLNVSGPL
jgi:hypothetical protein